MTPNRGMGPPWGAFCQITLTYCLLLANKLWVELRRRLIRTLDLWLPENKQDNSSRSRHIVPSCHLSWRRLTWNVTWRITWQQTSALWRHVRHLEKTHVAKCHIRRALDWQMTFRHAYSYDFVFGGELEPKALPRTIFFSFQERYS